MLPHSQRLSVGQFAIVMKKGRVSHSPLFLMRNISNMPDTRVAVVVPQKTSKSAVVRNALRRKSYDATQTFRETIKPGVHIIIFAKQATIIAKQSDIISDLKTLFVKSGLML